MCSEVIVATDCIHFKLLTPPLKTPSTVFMIPINMAESDMANGPTAFEFDFRDVFPVGACSCMAPSTQGPQEQHSFDESATVVGSVKTADTAVSSRQAEESSRSCEEPVSREGAEESTEPIFTAYRRLENIDVRVLGNKEDEFEVTVDARTLDQPHKIEPRTKLRVGSKVWRSVRENGRYFTRGSSMLVKRSSTTPTKRVETTFSNRIQKSDSTGSTGSF